MKHSVKFFFIEKSSLRLEPKIWQSSRSPVSCKGIKLSASVRFLTDLYPAIIITRESFFFFFWPPPLQRIDFSQRNSDRAKNTKRRFATFHQMPNTRGSNCLLWSILSTPCISRGVNISNIVFVSMTRCNLWIVCAKVTSRPYFEQYVHYSSDICLLQNGEILCMIDYWRDILTKITNFS